MGPRSSSAPTPRAWPGGDLVPADIENMDIEEAYKAARERRFGDTLLSFVVIELYEGLDEEDGKVDLERASHLIDRGISDLQAVSQAIAKLAQRPVCRGCDGAGTLTSGETCDECKGSGLAPEDWAEREDYQ